jgi:hypothetical protein
MDGVGRQALEAADGVDVTEQARDARRVEPRYVDARAQGPAQVVGDLVAHGGGGEDGRARVNDADGQRVVKVERVQKRAVKQYRILRVPIVALRIGYRRAAPGTRDG